MAPFPAAHSGRNISLGLDAMVEELGLVGEQWELFAVNDNAANVKLGIKLSLHLNQYLCDIHTIELAVKDTFKNVPGVKALLKKTRALAKFVKKSPTAAEKELRKESEKEKVAYRKLANPPNTRWCGKLGNLESVQYLKKPLVNLMSRNDKWHKYSLTPGQWNLLDVAVKLLKPVKETILAWEAEKTPTMHRVIERLYTLQCTIDAFIEGPESRVVGVGFARELKTQLDKRFPLKGTQKNLARMANYLAPQFKGMHLEEAWMLESAKMDIEGEVLKISVPEVRQEVFEEAELEERVELSPNSKLREKRRERMQRGRTVQNGERKSPLRMEMEMYESLTLSDKHVNILHWWRSHEGTFPNLAKVAKKVLSIPASSAKSESVFSTGGNFVTKKRNRLAAKKVEELCLVKTNKAQIDAFKARGSYELVAGGSSALASITVDEVFENLEKDENSSSESESEAEDSTDSSDDDE